MRQGNGGVIESNRVFAWIALGTAALLMVLLLATQAGSADWGPFDFVAAGVLIFGAGAAFVMAARIMPGRRLLVGLLVAAAFAYLWAELAVGVFTDWGS